MRGVFVGIRGRGKGEAVELQAYVPQGLRGQMANEEEDGGSSRVFIMPAVPERAGGAIGGRLWE
ncbi:hypothetical protein LINGRAHAP2_LOCUS15208 [Linum grandiflorum]